MTEEKTKKQLCDEAVKEYCRFADNTEIEAFAAVVIWAQGNPDYEGCDEKKIKAVIRGRLMSRDVYRKLPESATAKPAKKRTTPSKADLTELCFPKDGEDKAPGTFQNQSKLDICLVGLMFSELPLKNYTALEKYRDILQAEKDNKE